MNAIEIKGLTKSYPGFKLDRLNLVLPEGCIMGLVGENGAGKSTAIKLMLGMLRKESGSVSLLGKDTDDMTALKEEIGVVLDDVGIPGCLSPKQTGKVMSHAYKNWDNDKYTSLLNKFSLPEDKQFKEFSKGMKMKLGIALAMSHDAKLLLLDEPTSGLDPVVRDEVVEMLIDYTREENHSILISSHIVSDLQKLCDYIAFLHKGKLLICEEKDRLLDEYGMLNCTEEELADIPQNAIKHIKENPYGIEALVMRAEVPAAMDLIPVTIEDLFVFMVKEAE